MNGEISYSALRELTRVVTPNTQRAWLEAVRGKSVRQVEELVRTHRKGDLPTDPADPDLKPRRLSFEVTTATDALLREARKALADERGRFVEDDEFLAAMATAILGGAANESDDGRAKFQVRVTTCDACAQTCFEGGGRKIAVTDSEAARADCDAQRIGADERAAQDIPPKTRREVIHRDGGKCAVPRCRSARFTEIHHIVARSEGGSHDASNLCCLCDGHHKLLHERKLRLSGRAPNIVVEFANDAIPHVETHVTARHVETTQVKTNAFAAAVASVEAKRVATSSVPDAPQAKTPAAARHIENPICHVKTKPDAAVVASTVVPSTNGVDEAPAAAPHVALPTRAAARHLDTEIPHVETRPRELESNADTNVGLPRLEAAPNAYAAAVMRADAKQALTQLGFAPAASAKYVTAALTINSPPLTSKR